MKRKACSPVQGEGYTTLPGKELFAFRPGSCQPQLQHLRDLDQACSAAEALSHSVLSALCRSAALDMHPAPLLGLLDDTPRRAGRPSSSVLHVSRYDNVDPGGVQDSGGGLPTGGVPGGGGLPAPAGPRPAVHRAFLPHHDRGMLTLVASEAVSGLQVRSRGGGGSDPWVDVPLGRGRVAVLVGYSLSYALGGLLQPTEHRVRPDAGGRLSLAYKLCCRPAARVDPRVVLEEATTQPEGPVDRALTVPELMHVFSNTHPISINGVAPAAPAVAGGPLAPAQDAAGAGGAAAVNLGPAAAGQQGVGAPQQRNGAVLTQVRVKPEPGAQTSASLGVQVAAKRQRMEVCSAAAGVSASGDRSLLPPQQLQQLSQQSQAALQDRGDEGDAQRRRRTMIEVAIVVSSGGTYGVRLFSSTPFRKVLYKLFEDNWSSYRLMSNGMRIHPDSTPKENGIEDGDEIIALAEQIGD